MIKYTNDKSLTMTWSLPIDSAQKARLRYDEDPILINYVGHVAYMI